MSSTTSTSPPSGRPGRDDSLSLLWRIVDDAIDPGYAEHAVRSPVSNWRQARLGHSLALAVALLVLATLVTASVIQAERGAPSAARTRADLAERVVASTAQTDALAKHVEDLTRQTADLRAAALSGSAADQALADRVAALEAAVGARGVVGPGLEVTLRDGPPAPINNSGPDLARLLDRDLQLAVNGLWASGAEAVSVNGQRITSLSAIRGAGDALLVGYRPLTPPYVLSAVGPPSLESEFNASSAAEQLHTLSDVYGIGFDVQAQDEVTVPGQPDLTVRYATRGGHS
ncbi:MAG TPA: DUF881 domain-containing protein [Actinomycetes bacterium]|nr:DUF881 domain-containing protein [Actinomycetes bacterium]